MWHKPCRTFHPWCLCIKTRCLVDLCYEIYTVYVVLMGRLDGGQSGMLQGRDLTAPVNVKYRASCETSSWRNICKGNSIPLLLKQIVFGYNSIIKIFFDSWALVAASVDLCYEIYILYVVLMGRLDGGQSGMLQGWDFTAPVNIQLTSHEI